MDLTEALAVIDHTVDQHMSITPRTNATTAEKILAELEEQHPAAVRVWLDTLGRAALMQMMRSRDARNRAAARNPRVAAARAVRDAGKPTGRTSSDGTPEFTGDTTALSVFTRSVFVVDREQTRKTVGAMTGPDHRYVAEGYSRTSKRAAVEATFHRLVAGRIPAGKTTADVFTEEEYLAVRDRCLSTAA